MALSLNDLKKGKASKNASSNSDPNRRMVRPWEDPSQKENQTAPPKPVANQGQTGSKLVAETDSKLVANQEQTRSSQNSSETKLVAQPVARRVANQEQTGSKLVAKSDLMHLVGNERKL